MDERTNERTNVLFRTYFKVWPHLRAQGCFSGFQLALVGDAGGLLFAKVDVSLSGGLVEPPLAVGTLDVV